MRYFGVDPSIADRLPELQEADVRFDDDFTAPEPGADDGLLKPRDERSFEVVFGEGDSVGPLELKQRGLAAMINATAATTTARLLLAATSARGRHGPGAARGARRRSAAARSSTPAGSRWSWCW